MTKLSKVFYFLTRLQDTHARKANPRSERAGGSQYWTGGRLDLRLAILDWGGAGLEARAAGLGESGRRDLRLEMLDWLELLMNDYCGGPKRVAIWSKRASVAVPNFASLDLATSRERGGS